MNFDIECRIGLLGLGKMAFALTGGILSSELVKPSLVSGFDISAERRRMFADMGCRAAGNAIEVVRNSDVIIICVKPQNFTELFAEIGSELGADKLVVSIAAGVPVARIKTLAGCDLPVVRVMPNNPMLVNSGVSVIASEDPVTEEQLTFVEKLFASSGATVRAAESDINPTIAIHSSSPAYIYLFTKAVADYAEQVGFSRETAVEMFAQTLIGSGKMILESGGDLDGLIAAVKSPKGTTAEALDVFEKRDFCGCIIEAMQACTRRADELAKLN